jgi:ABC-type nitrate/sulfonate/bicarbonate transport system substrate-binding protein
MASSDLLTRRHILRAGTALGLAGSLTALQRPARGVESGKPPGHIEIVNPSGTERLIFQNMLKEPEFLQAFGLDANFVNVGDGTKILAALISGNGDLCTGAGVAALFPAIAKGAKLKIIAGASIKPVNAIFAKRDDVKEAKDLVGKTVGVGAPGALLHSLMVAFFEKEGVDYKKVNFVNVGSSNDVFKALLQGSVDAGPIDGNFIEQQANYGIHVIKDGALWDSLPEFTNTCIFTTDETIAAKRDILVRALAMHAKLFRYILDPKSKAEFFKARAEAFGKDVPEDADAQWRFYQTTDTLATNLLVSKESIDYLQKLNIQLGVQDAMLPYERVADMSLAQEALKSLT